MSIRKFVAATTLLPIVGLERAPGMDGVDLLA